MFYICHGHCSQSERLQQKSRNSRASSEISAFIVVGATHHNDHDLLNYLRPASFVRSMHKRKGTWHLEKQASITKMKWIGG